MDHYVSGAKKYSWKRRSNHTFLKMVAIVLLAAVIVTVTVLIIHGQAKGIDYPSGSGLVYETAVVSESPLISNSQMESLAPSFAKKPAEGFLTLVNWEHPITSEERPSGLVTMGTIFDDDLVLVNPDASINQTAGEAAKAMFEAARDAGVGKYIITSAYRSKSYQETLFQERLKQEPGYADFPYANPVSVLPGRCSEHTTGLAIDIMAENYRNADDGYADSPEGKWLQENAYRFGFILRYPKDKEHITGVKCEPWHFRYVGVEAAAEMFELGLCLEEYVAVT